MKKSRRQLMIEQVKIEAKNLIENARQKELQRLNINSLSVRNANWCVYGQLTGNCYSDRAHALIKKCAKKVYIQPEGNDLPESELNGSPKYKRRKVGRATKYWSPIEVFIAQYNDNQGVQNETLFKFLKGETKTLNLK